MSRDGTSDIDATAFADAPLAIDKDMPTAPSTGTASFARIRFEPCFVWGMSVLPCLLANVTMPPLAIRTPCISTVQGRLTCCDQAARRASLDVIERMPDLMNDT